MSTGIPKKQPNKTSLHQTDLGVQISYKDKSNEDEILQTTPANISVLWSPEVETTNRLYYGDNLPILASMLNDKNIKGKIRLIYIDPPYATNSVFQSRSQNDAYTDLLVGAPYIEFLRKRLILLRELLADDGSIYVHLDENMAFHIKVIMDEVFGSGNFRNWITRKKCNPKNYTRKTYGDISDYILFYTKSDTYVWNRPVEAWTDKTSKKEYTYVEENTGRRYKKVPIHAPGTRNGETGKQWRGMNPPPGKHWQYTPKTLDEMDARGEIFWSSNGNPRRKIYLDQSEGIPVQDIWLDFRDAHNQNIHITGYPTEKNPDLLSRIIQASSNPNDLILDCFSGSGTTLAMSSKLDRRWIGIDSSPEAITTTLNRFANGTERMGDFVSKPAKVISQENIPVTLSMFETDTQSVDSEPIHLVHEKIENFALCTTGEYSGELDQTLQEWWGFL